MIGDHKRLTKFCGHDNWKHRLFEWECLNCGKQHPALAINHITRTKLPHCCMRSYKYGAATHGYMDINSSYMVALYGSAKTRGLEFDIDARYLWEVWLRQSGRCAYSGIGLTLQRPGQTASVDRINNDRGYVLGNVQWLDKRVNQMKLTMPESEFLELCSMITNRQKEKENDDSK